MVFETEILEGGVLRMNCLGSIYGSSLEDSDVIMSKVMDVLVAEKKITGIILAESREYEYDFPQTKLLLEIANALTEIMREKKIISVKNFGRAGAGCENLFSAWYSWASDLATVQLRSDPVGAYVNLTRELRHAKIKAASHNCYAFYVANVLEPLRTILENCSLIQTAKPYLDGYHIGDRSIYREIFHPSVRPNFMYTKYMMQPPEGEAVERYKTGDTDIEIFRLPGTVRPVYHIIPPEFRLTEDEYVLLDQAKRILEERRPREFEMKDQEKMREIFYNIGIELLRDLAEQGGKAVTQEQLERLSSILTRYTAGLGIIEVLLADENVQDVYINSPLGAVPSYIYHSKYEECETNLIPTRTDGERWATRFKLMSGRPLDEANPVLDTETAAPGGRARVAAIYPKLSPDGMGFALRRHRDRPWTLPLFLDAKFINPLFAGLLSFVTDYGRTYLIAGTRSSGKSSLLGALMLEIQPRFRIISVEDTLELPVEQLRTLGYNIERMKSRSVITHVETELPADEAIRTALRLGDSSLIIGEVRSSLRGNEEVVIIDNGETKRVAIESLEGKNIEGLQVPTLGFDLKMKVSKLGGFVKHPEREKLIEIITQTGRKITVTHDHSLFTATRDFRIAAIECNKLKKGDSIVIPTFIPCGFNDIDSLNLLEMLPEFRVENFEKPVRDSIEKVGWKKASEICKIRTGDIYNYFRTNQKTNIPIESFRNLAGSAGVEFDPSELFVRRGTSNRIPAIIPVNEDFCRFLGYYVSEGYHFEGDGKGGAVVLTNSDKKMLDDFASLSRSLFGIEPCLRQVEGAGISTQARISSAPLAKMISRLGCGRICTEKRAPPIVYGLSKNKIASFLKGLYSGDGGFSSSAKSGNCVRYFTTSKLLAEDVMYLLLSFGIVATLRKKDVKKGNTLWIVEFKNRKMVETFLNEIGFVQKQPKPLVRAWPHTRSSTVYFDREALRKHLTTYPRRYRHLFRFGRCSKEYLEKVVSDNECEVSERLKEFACGDFFLDAIKEIREIELEKPEPVYDLSVEPSQNFVAGFGGILAHNTEARALYEAMRIGALANVVAGTIHGDSAYGVFDRVVNDLGVPPTSFKATDLIVICNRLRSADGLHSFRRVTGVTEVRKHWKSEPADEGGFVDLMEYSSKADSLKPSGTLLNGESTILNEIAENVREWAGNWGAVWDNINLRGRICQATVKIANHANKNLMEAETVVESNQMFHMLSERSKNENGFIDADRVYAEWLEWFKERAKGGRTNST